MRLLLSLLFISFFSVVDAQIEHFTIFSFNGIKDIPPKDQNGGLASMYSLLKKERIKTKHHLTLLHGDVISPQILSCFDQGSHMIDLLNHMNIDASIFGNHEFDFGMDILLKRIAESKFPWLAANLLEEKPNTFTKQDKGLIYNFGSMKVGVFGLSPYVEENDYVYMLSCKEAIECQCQFFKEQKVDVVIALVHMHTEEISQLLRQVDGIDLILSGHESAPLCWYENNTWIIMNSHQEKFLSRLDITVEKKKGVKGSQTKLFPSLRMIVNENIAVDKQLQTKIDEYVDRFDSQFFCPIAQLKEMLDSTYHTIRSQKTPIGSLVAYAVKNYCNADVAIIPSGSMRGDRKYFEGEIITKKDVYREFVFNNRVIMVRLLGERFKDILEEGLSKLEKKSGHFLHSNGICFSYDLNKEKGQRIVDTNIIPEQYYNVATLDYLQNAPNSFFEVKKAAQVRQEFPLTISQIIIKYLKKEREISTHIIDR